MKRFDGLAHRDYDFATVVYVILRFAITDAHNLWRSCRMRLHPVSNADIFGMSFQQSSEQNS